jgi:hypothetical protein
MACVTSVRGSAAQLAMLAVVFSATVYTTVQGLTYPLLSLILERAGANSFTIGLSAAMMPLGMVAAGLVGPGLGRVLWIFVGKSWPDQQLPQGNVTALSHQPPAVRRCRWVGTNTFKSGEAD